MKRFKFLLALVLITSFIAGCGSNSEKETTKKTSKDKTKETTKKKEKVKLLNDNDYYTNLAQSLFVDNYCLVDNAQIYEFDDPNITCYFDNVKTLRNDQIDYYIDWYLHDHYQELNLDQYYDDSIYSMNIPNSLRNEICKMLFDKDYYGGSEGIYTKDRTHVTGFQYTARLEVETPILQDDGTVLIKANQYDLNDNSFINTYSLCIKEINKDKFRIVYSKRN